MFTGFEVKASSYDYTASIEVSSQFNVSNLMCTKCILHKDPQESWNSFFSTLQCLENPQKPQYNGGIITNPELDNGLEGWTGFGGAKMKHMETGGNKYIVAHSRNQPHDSVSQKIYLQKHILYTLSGKW